MNFFKKTKASVSSGKVSSHPLAWARNITRDPSVDWPIMCAIALIVAVTFSLISYGAYGDNGAPVSDDSSPPDIAKVFDQNALKKAISDLDARAIRRAALSRGYSGPGDPSI